MGSIRTRVFLERHFAKLHLTRGQRRDTNFCAEAKVESHTKVPRT
jgi:hypothetical protein